MPIIQKLRLHIAIRLISLALLPLIWFYPASLAWAETTTTTTSTDTAPTTSTSATPTAAPTPSTSTPTTTKKSTTKPKTTTTGPTKPTGDASSTYKYNEQTGLWENDHYTWDPVTKQTAPKDAPTYSYNPTTGMWDTTTWRYDATSGKYVPNVTSTSQAPAGANSNLTNPNSNSGQNDNNSPSSTQNNSNSTGTFDLFYNAQISNNINSTATSGDSLVAQNTIAGDALSGSAQAIANIINMLQSSWSPGGNQPVTFINNVTGNVYGDLVIDPTHLPTSNLTGGQSQNANLDVNVQNSGQINNQINLAANSGNATVSGNTQAGNATTGSAQAIANIVNMINSTIASGQSFVGMINIDGNYNGDILMPADMINQLLSSNKVPTTTIDASKVANGTLLANFNNNSAINNQISTTANSGNATVAHNTMGGNATTGTASTNLTVLNLTGQEVIGKDALLVFVNVQGKWLGMIVNAPGSTSALLGGGISSNTSNSNANITGNSDLSINNNINASANSGNATVSGNTQAGNATSGDASASVNVANLLNSNFSLSNWFGVLFINITGDWTGSFGVNTSAGNPIISNKPVTGVAVFRFVPKSSGASTANSQINPVFIAGNSGSGQQNASQNNAVLASQASVQKPAVNDTYLNSSTKSRSPWLISGASLVFAGVLMGIDRTLSLRKKSIK